MNRRKLLALLFLVSLLLATGCLDRDIRVPGDGNQSPIATTTPQINEENATILSLEDQLIEVYKQAIPSVVSVVVYPNTSLQSTNYRGARGTGWVYSDEGHIITNEHVVRGGKEVLVTFSDGEEVPVEIVGTSPYNDLAVLKVDPKKHSLKPLELENSSELEIGRMVVALGNPLGFEGSYTHGIVSGLDRKMPVRREFSIPRLIQVDVPINQGNSGGPLLTLTGKVVGVNTAKIQGDNIGFAVPSTIVKRVVPVLIEEGEYSYPWIGIRTLDVNQEMAEEMGLKEATGVMIASVVPNSPAEEAGLQGLTDNITVRGMTYAVGGDVIVEIDNRKVQEIDDILSYLAVNAEVGDEVRFTIIRDGQQITKELILGERPQ